MFQESLDHSHHDDCTNLSSAESVSSELIWSICTIGTVTSVQDPVLEVVSELQCKIADLGNACWEVCSESHNINTVTLLPAWPLSGVLIKLVHKMVYFLRPLLL